MFKDRVIAPILAFALVAGASAYEYPAVAATSDTAAAENTQDLIKLSDDGYAAMRAVRAARLAIFNGDPDGAKALVTKAETSLQAAEKEAPEFSVKTEVAIGDKASSSEEKGQVEYVPIDAQLGLVDNFVMTPEKAAHIKKANEHLKAGDSKKALDEFKQGEIDINYVRVLMPLTATKRHVDAAEKLLADNKYYESNLALKAAEDGILIDTVSLDEMPEG